MVLPLRQFPVPRRIREMQLKLGKMLVPVHSLETVRRLTRHYVTVPVHSIIKQHLHQPVLKDQDMSLRTRFPIILNHSQVE
jgi:hypothetical protein